MALTYDLALIALISGVFYIIYSYWTNRRFYALAAKIPGPKMIPFIGVAPMFMDHKEIVNNGLKLLLEYNTPLKLWVFTVLLVAVSKPNDLKAVLNSPHCLEKEERYKVAKAALGDGLLTAEASLWKQRRKMINPTFNPKILESFMTVFKTQSKVLVQQLEKEVDQPAFDIHEYLSRCTLDIICETALGIKVEAQIKQSKLMQASRRVAITTVERAFKIWLHSDFIFKLTKTGKQFYNDLKFVHDFSGDIIHKRKQEYAARKMPVSNGTREENNGPIKRKPFLEHLISMGEGVFTETALRNEVDTFMHAGSDTTTTAVGYVLLALAIHQNVQEKVFQELNEVFENSDREITLEDVHRFEYLDMVVKETMRLYPVVPFVARTAVKDIDIADGKYTIPAGSAIVIPIVHTHIDSEFWPDPYKFNPYRFLPEEVAKRDPYSYIPFSGGPRNCIGIRYAHIGVRTIVSSILREYQIHTQLEEKKLKFSVEIVSKLVGGVMVTLTKRKR